MEENANKLHLCTDFNSSMRVTAYAKFICQQYLKYQAYEGTAIFFSLCGLPLPCRLSTAPVSLFQQLINTKLCSAF